MTKKKKKLFFLLVILIVGFKAYPYIFEKESPDLTLSQRNKTENTANNLVLKADDDYNVDNKKLNQGFYDITCVEGNVRIYNVYLNKGSKLKGVAFYNNNSISVEGNGRIKLAPSNFQKLSFSNNEVTLDKESIIVQAGNEIAPGTYTLKVKNKSNLPFYIYVNIDNYENNSTNAQSYDIKDSTEINFSINKGEFLKVLNWSKENADLSISIKKQ